MHPDFDHRKNLGFKLLASLTPGYKGFILPGAEAGSAEGKFGKFLYQNIITPEFQIRFQAFDLLEPQGIPSRQEKAFLVALLPLRNTIQYFIKGLGQFELKQGQFALLHTPEQDAFSRFEKTGSYQSLEIAWSEKMAKQVLPHFSLLKPLFSGKEKTRPFYLHQPGQLAGTRTLDIARAILKSPYDNTVSLLYFKYKAQEYLLSILTEADKGPGIKTQLTDDEHENILSISDKLTNHINQHFPISRLAKETRMNETKLKQAFKEIFGMGIFEYQLEARMKEAHRLLIETDLSTKAIASLVGYELGTSFITKFREYFGYAPSELGKGR
jgi:AraC-like DNA-binding protein